MVTSVKQNMMPQLKAFVKKKKNTQYYFMCKKFSMIYLET